MKQFHIPTLVMHILLPVFARLTINDYPDFFLGASILVLLVHVMLAIKSKRDFLPTHIIGIALQALAMYLGIVREDPGPFGLGGGFALFFYQIALAISFAVISLNWAIRRIKTR